MALERAARIRVRIGNYFALQSLTFLNSLIALKNSTKKKFLKEISERNDNCFATRYLSSSQSNYSICNSILV